MYITIFYQEDHIVILYIECQMNEFYMYECTYSETYIIKYFLFIIHHLGKEQES